MRGQRPDEIRPEAPRGYTRGVDLAALVDRVPPGWSAVTAGGRRWGLSREDRADGRSVSLYAEALDGDGVVSANVYRTAAGDRLMPCEMPAETVLAFLRDWRPASDRPFD